MDKYSKMTNIFEIYRGGIHQPSWECMTIQNYLIIIAHGKFDDHAKTPSVFARPTVGITRAKQKKGPAFPRFYAMK
jgi:hypothetical protein